MDLMRVRNAGQSSGTDGYDALSNTGSGGGGASDDTGSGGVRGNGGSVCSHRISYLINN